MAQHGSWASYLNPLQVFHPNIDMDGAICLNILREDWKPVLNINQVVYGLLHILLVSPLAAGP